MAPMTFKETVQKFHKAFLSYCNGNKVLTKGGVIAFIDQYAEKEQLFPSTVNTVKQEFLWVEDGKYYENLLAPVELTPEVYMIRRQQKVKNG